MIRTTLSLFLLLISTTLFAQSGVVTTIAGTPGVAGYWDGPAADAMFTHPTWLDVVVGPKGAPTCDEGKSGEIFVVDRINQLVRRIAQSGNVNTFKTVRRRRPGRQRSAARLRLCVRWRCPRRTARRRLRMRSLCARCVRCQHRREPE